MLFIHDHTFVIKDGRHYTTGSLNQKVMDRYRDWFGSLSVFATERVATDSDSVFIRSENLVDNVDFHLVPKKRTVGHVLSCCKEVEKVVMQSDGIVVRMSIFGAIGVHYARKHNTPYLVEMVACPWDSLWYHSVKGKVLAPFMTLLTKYVCKKAPFVLYVTNEFLQRRYPTKGVQIGCSDVELTWIDQSILNKRIEKIQNCDEKKLKICTVANIAIKYKGQDLVIRSLKELKKYGIECEYYLVGGGSPERLQKVADECGVSNMVHFIGAKPHEDIFEILDGMDLYVQPSYQEGLPRAVIEAMSRGCPVVGSSTGGIPELIEAQCVFKKGSKDDFIQTVKQIKKTDLLRIASRNFEKSKEYEKNSLDQKRTRFYMDFAALIKKGK
jgi:glycosyltransferase involved in cell wall biosynthesis